MVPRSKGTRRSRGLLAVKLVKAATKLRIKQSTEINVEVNATMISTSNTVAGAETGSNNTNVVTSTQDKDTQNGSLADSISAEEIGAADPFNEDEGTVGNDEFYFPKAPVRGRKKIYTECDNRAKKASAAKQWREKRKVEIGLEAFNEEERERKRTRSTLAQLGTICVQSGVIISELSSVMDTNLLDKLSKLPPGGDSGRRCSKRSIGAKGALRINKAPIRTFKAAGYCADCRETCGPNGCSDKCKCLEEERRCIHSSPFYYCETMLDRFPFKRVMAVPEPFIVNALSSTSEPVSNCGLQILEDCAAGCIIGEFTGTVLKKSDRLVKQLLQVADKYLMELDSKHYIDGSTGSEMRFINSSCDPNVKFVRWGGFPEGNRIFVVAIKNITAPAMAYAKYGWSARKFGTQPIKIKCLCKFTDECKKGLVFL